MSDVAIPTTGSPSADAPAVARDDASTLTYEEFRETRYFAALDGIRAVAVLLVFTSHLAYQNLWQNLWGLNGVRVFFVLSGFIITTLALREESRTGRMSLRSFYIRRVFRIYPVYFAVLALYCALIYLAGFEAERRGLFSHQLPFYAFGMPEYGDSLRAAAGHDAPFSGAWSIGVEEKFYLVWPLLAFVIFRGSMRLRLTALALAAAVFIIVPAPLGSIGDYLRPYLFIALGCAVALLAHRRDQFERVRALGRPGVLAGAIAAFVALQLLMGSGTLSGWGFLVLDGVIIAIALAGIAVSRGPVSSLLASGPMVFLGRISYPFYLTHNFPINFVERTPLGQSGALRSIVDAGVSLTLAILVAWVIHVTFEKRLIAIGHRLAHRGAKAFHGV